MKVLALWISSVIVGAVLGYVVTVSRLDGVRERFDDAMPSAMKSRKNVASLGSAALSPTVDAGAAVAVVNGSVHDFGEFEYNGRGRHEFILKNVGESLVRLENGGTSCGACTISKIEKSELRPGETCVVAVEWHANSTDGDFRKEAYVRTNDPKNQVVKLAIKGKIQRSLKVEPELISFASVSQSGESERIATLYWNRAEPLAIKNVTVANESIAQFFATRVDPLSAEELASRPTAKQGFRLTVRLKPGLPLGAIQQTIRLATDRPDMPHVEIPVHGNVTGDISFVGAKYDERANAINLGTVRRGEMFQTTLQVLVKGPHRQSVVLGLEQVEPKESLQASFGDAKSLNNGAVLMSPLSITVPSTSPTINRMGGPNGHGYGKIVISTTHPDSPRIELRVKFAVEE